MSAYTLLSSPCACRLTADLTTPWISAPLPPHHHCANPSDPRVGSPHDVTDDGSSYDPNKCAVPLLLAYSF